MQKKVVDKPFLIITSILILLGFFLFVSASLGLLAREGARFSSVAFNQIAYGLIGGSIAMYLTSRMDYLILKKYSFYFFIFSLFMTVLVFIPSIGFSAGGATRWISLGPLPSFQPVELLKLGFVIYFAAWISGVRQKIRTFQFGLLPLMIIIGIIGTVLLAQPDTGSLLIISAAGLAMFITAGGRWKDVLIVGLIGIVLLSGLVYTRPYVLDRIKTFVNPGADLQGSSYQLNQSLIAIGSGKIFGRGFGQSVQKFNYLPEPIGDSIFAVAAEEWGFVGSFILIFLFLAFALRGLKIAASAKDMFGGLLATGIVILIIVQSLVNIASMLGVFPLTGMPLLFVSHGGTALLFAMAEVGIVLNISKHTVLT
jgi:cell division protein FtsW